MSAPNGKRNATLPLPTSLSAVSSPPTQPTRLPASSSSPTAPYFTIQGPHSPPSTTHAGGIQPSSSFFRPARPNQQPKYSPQPSIHEDHLEHAPDHYPLSPLNHDQRRLSLGHASLDPGAVTDTTDEQPHPPRTGTKQSREPLLPITGGHTRKPSVTATTPAALKTTAHRVRTSIDRVFGLSFPGRPSADRPFDEERADKLAPPSSRTPSPGLSQRTSASPSPTPSFIATPPGSTLAHVPVIRPDSSKPLRRHAEHPSRNRFFLGGRILSGGDTPFAFLASLSVILGLAAVWFSTTCVFWWHHSQGTKAIVILGAYLAALVLSTMFSTATTDPGILPRGLDPDPPYPATSPSDGGVRAPMPRDLRVRSDVVRVKYCPTCKTYRPPRSSHCKMCDNCVDGCDHHCQWVNNCVGRRNYTTFFALLCCGATTLFLILITSALHLWLLATRPPPGPSGFRHALSDKQGIGSAIAFCMSVALIWPVGALLGYHARLLLLNITTIEQIRNQAHTSVLHGEKEAQLPPNPFSHGTRRRNFAAVLCRPKGFSWLDAHAIVTRDLREVNPGMRVGVGSRVDEEGS